MIVSCAEDGYPVGECLDPIAHGLSNYLQLDDVIASGIGDDRWLPV